MKKTLLLAFCFFGLLSLSASAAVTITPASGGNAISADDTGGSYTVLTGPTLAEDNAGDIGAGDIVLTAPTGFVFDTSSAVTVAVSGTGTGSDIVLNSSSAVVTTTTITITVNSPSDTARLSTLTWSGISVRPSSGTPLASGNITESGSSTYAVIAVPTADYGTLTEVHGAAASLTFSQQPASEQVGHPFSVQPVVRVLDFFNNLATDLPSSFVTISLSSGTGILFGQTNIDVGASAGAGIAAFTDLEINAYGNKQLTVQFTGVPNLVGSTFTNAGTAQRYALAGNYGTGNSPHGITLGNFRGQSTWRDIAVANTGDSTVSIRLCNDDGTFRSSNTNYPTGLGPVSPLFLDVDSDGRDEFIVANSGTNTITTWKNAGSGNFTQQRNFVISSNSNPGPVALAIGNLNGNGRPDVVTANTNDNTVSIAFGVAGGVFTNFVTYTVGATPSSVCIADINQDGHPDILTANTTDGTISILYGVGDGTFVYSLDFTLFPAGDPQPVRLMVADMNKDHLPDLVTVNRGSNTVSIFTNDGGGSFKFSQSLATGTRPTDLLYRDLDVNGVNDLVVANSGSGTFTIFMQDTNGVFAAPETITAGRNCSALAGSNFNGDDLTDLAVVNTDDNTVGVYLYTAAEALPASVTVPENRTTTITLPFRAMLPAVFSFTPVTLPAHGTLVPTANPQKYDYTPDAGYVGADSFHFQVSDGSITSRLSTVSITVKLVNVAPTFTLISNALTLAEDAGAQSIIGFATNLNKGQTSELSQTLTFTVTNSNHALFATQPAINSSGTLTFKTATNVSGSALVGVILADNGGTASGGTNRSSLQTFTITVSAVNDAPKIAAIPAKSILEDGTLSFNLNVTDVDTAVSSLILTATSSNPGLVPNANIVPAYVGTNWGLTITPVANSNGTTVITIVADDQSGGLGTNHFTLTVTSVNDAPSFTLPVTDISVIGSSGLQTNIHFATNLLAGPANEVSQTLGFVLTGVDPSLYTTKPTINSHGDLVFAPQNAALGTNVISVHIKDSGTTANGGANLSPDQTFTIAITTNNFLHINGTYNGLFYDTPVQETSAGLINFALTTTRTFSGSIALDGGKYAFSGKQFDFSGNSTFAVTRGAKTTLILSLHVDLINGTDEVTGTVGDGTWAVHVYGERAVTNVTVPAPGNYTMALVGAGDGLTSPGGDGYASVKLAANGAVTLSGGILADTTAISDSSALSKTRKWPFYASLYSGGGSVIGWITFTNKASTDLEGSLSWIKPVSSSAFYPGGFTNSLTVVGSAFAITPNVSALSAVNGSVYLTGSTLPTLAISYTMNASSALTFGTNTNHLALTITTSTGFLKGSFNSIPTGNNTTIRGVLIQKENTAHGFFNTAHQSGDFLLQ